MDILLYLNFELLRNQRTLACQCFQFQWLLVYVENDVNKAMWKRVYSAMRSIFCTLANVYVDLLVFTRIAGTS